LKKEKFGMRMGLAGQGLRICLEPIEIAIAQDCGTDFYDVVVTMPTFLYLTKRPERRWTCAHQIAGTTAAYSANELKQDNLHHKEIHCDACPFLHT